MYHEPSLTTLIRVHWENMLPGLQPSVAFVSPMARSVALGCYAAGRWPLAPLVNQKGRRYGCPLARWCPIHLSLFTIHHTLERFSPNPAPEHKLRI